MRLWGPPFTISRSLRIPQSFGLQWLPFTSVLLQQKFSRTAKRLLARLKNCVQKENLVQRGLICLICHGGKRLGSVGRICYKAILRLFPCPLSWIPSHLFEHLPEQYITPSMALAQHTLASVSTARLQAWAFCLDSAES